MERLLSRLDRAAQLNSALALAVTGKGQYKRPASSSRAASQETPHIDVEFYPSPRVEGGEPLEILLLTPSGAMDQAVNDDKEPSCRVLDLLSPRNELEERVLGNVFGILPRCPKTAREVDGDTDQRRIEWSHSRATSREARRGLQNLNRVLQFAASK
jgi:hypothetical protein